MLEIKSDKALDVCFHLCRESTYRITQINVEKKTQDCAGLASGRALADGFKNRKERILLHLFTFFIILKFIQ